MNAIKHFKFLQDYLQLKSEVQKQCGVKKSTQHRNFKLEVQLKTNFRLKNQLKQNPNMDREYPL